MAASENSGGRGELWAGAGGGGRGDAAGARSSSPGRNSGSGVPSVIRAEAGSAARTSAWIIICAEAPLWCERVERRQEQQRHQSIGSRQNKSRMKEERLRWVQSGIGISLRLFSDMHLLLFPLVLTDAPADGRAPFVRTCSFGSDPYWFKCRFFCFQSSKAHQWQANATVRLTASVG